MAGAQSIDGPLRVLLLSPVRELDPPNGDVTYTEELLQNPPDEVQYTSYAQALHRGSLTRIDRRSVGWTPAVMRNVAVNRLRRLGVLFREPFGYFSMQPGAFDVVHVHCFSARLTGDDTPVVLTNAAPIEHVYRDVHRWAEPRVRVAAHFDRWLATVSGVHHSTYVGSGPAVIGSFTETMAAWRAERVVGDPGIVMRNFTQPRSALAVTSRVPVIALIAAHPDVKGADVFIDAVRQLNRDYAEQVGAVRFLVIGNLHGREDLRAACRELGIETHRWMPREELLERVFPSLTALAYPSRFDGSPFVVLEAMAQGVPVLTSDYFALPEIIGGHDCGGLVHPVGNAGVLAQHMLAVLDPPVAARLSSAARSRHAEAFVTDRGRRQLRLAYEIALSTRTQTLRDGAVA